MNFLPIAIFAYALNAGSTVVDKILLTKRLPNPAVYVFFISTMGLVTVFLAPFGYHYETYSAILAGISGLLANLALLAYFSALKKGEASVVAPIVGALNPLFSLFIGGLLLGQTISGIQLLAFTLLIVGSAILTFNIWHKKLRLNHQLLLMISAGFMFGLSYVLIREAFEAGNFISGLVNSRIVGGFFVLPFLIIPTLRGQIFSNQAADNGHFLNKTTLLLLFGQAMGAISAFLINYGISLASPALVNSLFGVQYLVILLIALFLAHEHRGKLLDEHLGKHALVQKVIGAGILSIGVYLLSK